MRVLWLIKGLGLGGAEILLARSIPHLDRDRFSYDVAYLLPGKAALASTFSEAGIPVHCLDAASPLHPFWLKRLSQLLARRRYDVIHVHSPYAAIGARLVARMNGSNGTRPRVCYTEHNMWNRYHRATYWANLVTYPLNDRVFTVSAAVRRSIRYPGFLRGMRLPELETLHEGIDFERVVDREANVSWRDELGIPAAAPVVGCVANLKAHKGLSYLVQSFRIVHASRPDAFFVVVGTGPEEERLRRGIQQAEMEHRAFLAGYRENVLDLVQGFSVFALASLYEGLSIAMLEAMALGVPVVATNVGGTSEALSDGVEGFLVPPKDPEALAARILRLLQDPALATRMGDAGRIRARAFDNRTAARRREQMYLELVSR